MNTEFAIKLIDIALNKGADRAEVYVKTSKSLGIEVKEQKIDTLESSMTMGYCIRVIKDNRLGFSYSTDPNEMNIVAEKAIEASKYSEPDEYLELPTPPPPPLTKGGTEGGASLERGGNGGVKIFDNDIAALPEGDAINLALLIENSAFKEDKRIKKIRKASGSFSANNTYIANSNGINVHYQSTGCSAQLMAIAEEGSESQLGWDYEGSRFLKDISFEQVGRNAARRAVQLLGARKINSVKGFVLLDNSVSAEFLGILSSALSAESVQKKKSMLAGKKGTMVSSNRLNIIDSGLLDKKLGSKPVDDEGVPTTHKILIEKGILKGYLYNTYTARKDGVVSTGNAVRGGFTGIPTVGPTNLYMEPASTEYTSSFEKLIKNIDKGLYVIETMGMHTANPISGEFSVGASGLWIERGEIKHPVKEAVISGNILELFKDAVMVGDDLRFYGNIGAPSLLIEEIDISG
ncbi:MAG: TldD/PmbA family protein [Nitrospirae bacterium]|nr:TldD/PmbA family protein [Nitrospirota bacterium]